MAGLVPAIHAVPFIDASDLESDFRETIAALAGVDARHKAGHDGPWAE